MNQNALSFRQITILPDKGETPAGSPTSLLNVIKGAFPEISYHTPYLPPGLDTADALRFLTDHYTRHIERDSLVVGFGRGGLLAVALQQAVPTLRLHAFAVNAPTQDGGVWAKMNESYYSRIAVYSSAYPPIRDVCHWEECSGMAYNVPWLSKGDVYYPLAYLIAAYGRGADINEEIKLIFPNYQEK